jgi:hypothetical protein
LASHFRILQLTTIYYLLFFLFRVHRVFAEAGAEFFELQLFTAGFAAEGVVVIARFFADEEDGFDFLFAFSGSHGGERVRGSEFRVQGLGALNLG